jgi:hypothetical protein
VKLAGRLLRVATYAVVVAVGVGGVAVKRAKARAAEGALLFGEQLLRNVHEDEASSRDLVVNGQTLHVSNAQTSLPLREVLDRFERQCEEHADVMPEDLATLETALEAKPARGGFPGIGVLRDQRDGRGVVACFAAGGPVDHADLAARLARFSETHDLGDVGHMRYIAARTLESGTTQVVATWTSSALRLDEIFPEHGDARGQDPSFGPRPASSVRVLSARDARAPYGVFLYEMRLPPESALEAYESDAATGGFLPIPQAGDRDVRVLTRRGVDLLVTATRHDDRTFLSIVEMPASGAR